MGFCSCTVKYMLILFNLVCAIGGLAILGVGVFSNVHGGSFKEMLSGQVTVASICLMVLGAVVFLIAFFGCCGALREDTCMIQTYAVLLLVILLVEVAIGVTAFIYKNKVKDELKNSAHKFFDDYYSNADNKRAIDDIQTSLECCGLNGPDYWKGKNSIPKSCCKSQRNCDIDHAFKSGCYDKIKENVRALLGIIGVVAVVVAVIELVGVICAFYVASNIRKQERRGYV